MQLYRKGSWSPGDNKFRMSVQSAAGQRRPVGGWAADIPSRDQEVIISLYSAWNAVFKFGPSYTKKMWTGWTDSKKRPQR